MRLKLMTASDYRAVLDLPGRLFYVYVLTNRAAMKPMVINGVDYESCAQAANALGVCRATIYYRFNNNWSGYSYKEL